MWPARKEETLREHCRLQSKYGDTFNGLPGRKGQPATSKANQMFDNMKGWISSMERRLQVVREYEDQLERLRLEQADVPVDAPRHGEITSAMVLLAAKASKQRAANQTTRYGAI